jgi:hypothetical protein
MISSNEVLLTSQEAFFPDPAVRNGKSSSSFSTEYPPGSQPGTVPICPPAPARESPPGGSTRFPASRPPPSGRWRADSSQIARFLQTNPPLTESKGIIRKKRTRNKPGRNLKGTRNKPERTSAQKHPGTPRHPNPNHPNLHRPLHPTGTSANPPY